MFDDDLRECNAAVTVEGDENADHTELCADTFDERSRNEDYNEGQNAFENDPDLIPDSREKKKDKEKENEKEGTDKFRHFSEEGSHSHSSGDNTSEEGSHGDQEVSVSSVLFPSKDTPLLPSGRKIALLDMIKLMSTSPQKSTKAPSLKEAGPSQKSAFYDPYNKIITVRLQNPDLESYFGYLMKFIYGVEINMTKVCKILDNLVDEFLG